MIKEEDIREGLRFVLPKLKEDRESVTYGNSAHRFSLKRCAYKSNRFFVVTHIDKDGINFCTDTEDQAFCIRRESIGSIFCDADYYWWFFGNDGVAFKTGISEETVNKLNCVLDMSQNAMSFSGIIAKMQETYIKKNHDYGSAFSEMYDELGINYGYGKIREKVNRIKTLKDGDAMVENEPLEDALLDCANYCILTLMEYQKHKKDGKYK